MNRIYNIYSLLLLLLSVGVVGCQKDNDDFSLSSTEKSQAIESIYSNMVGISELGEFSIGCYEVTQAQWQAVVDYNPSRVKGSNRPVESVTYNDVVNFINELNIVSGRAYRLPTPTEWSTAASSIPSDLDNYAWYAQNSDGTPHEVGGKSPNANGLFDMYGNVAEYVAWNEYSEEDQSYYDAYYDEYYAVGGSWNATSDECNAWEYADAQYKYNEYYTYRVPTLGLRLAIDEYIEPVPEEEGDEESDPTSSGTILIDSDDYLSVIGTDPNYPLSGNYKLTTDISMRAWTPIGTEDNPFTGTFDGGDNTIYVLETESGESYQGLFGYISGATIKNVIVSDPGIEGGSCTGAIVGCAEGAFTIQYCIVTGGSVSGSYNVGGIVGCTEGALGTIKDCSNVGTAVTGSSINIGGIVGYTSSTVEGCCNTGSVQGGNKTAGIAGLILDSSTVNGCYNTGSVTGSENTGGIVGQGYISIPNVSMSIIACYNIGTITTSSSHAGGIVGYSNGYITSCFNVGSVNTTSSSYNASTYVGYIVGCASSKHTYCYYIDQSGDKATSWAGTVLEDSSGTATSVSSASDLNGVITKMNLSAGDYPFTSGSPANTNLPHLMDENLRYTGTGAVEPDTDSDTIVGDAPDMEYETLF